MSTKPARQIDEVMAPIFALLPIAQAMPTLVGERRPSAQVLAAAQLADPELPSPELRAALWLYVDDLEQSHRISQGIETQNGAFWHAVMHRREGEFENSRYWLHQAKGSRLFAADSLDLLECVITATDRSDPKIVMKQRQEWKRAYDACVTLAEEPWSS